MRRVAFFRWLIPDPNTGQFIPSRHLMDDRTGESIPGAKKLPDSLEWRSLPEPMAVPSPVLFLPNEREEVARAPTSASCGGRGS